MNKIILLMATMTIAFTASADKYRITRLNESPITIGGNPMKVNQTFDSESKIEWKSDNQVMEAVNTETGVTVRARKRVNRQSKSDMKVSDFIVHTSYGSSRDTDGKAVPQFTMSSNSSKFPDRRAALVIGNSNYSHLSPLRNAQNDAVAISDQLLSLGFDVMEMYECDGEDLKTALIEFCRKASGYDFVMFYYAGHGIQDDNHNYLVPVDSPLELKSELRDCLDCEDVSGRFETLSAQSRLIVLDACRNTKKTWTRSADSGLARMEAGRGSIILFSTESGRVALDGEGDHSPFAAALLSNISIPDKSLNDVINGIVRDTYATTNQNQYPMQMGTILTDFYFNANGTAPQTTVTATSPTAPVSKENSNKSNNSPAKGNIQPEYTITKSVEPFDIDILSTRLSGNKLVINVIMTNLLRYPVCPIFSPSETFAFDDLGNKCREIRSEGLGGPYESGMFPPGVPVVHKITIPDFDPEASVIALFKMQLSNNYSHFQTCEFEARNIPLNFNQQYPEITDEHNTVSMTAADFEAILNEASITGNKAKITFKLTNYSKKDSQFTTNTLSAGNYHTIVIDDKGRQLNQIRITSSTKGDLPAGLSTLITMTIDDLDNDTRLLPYVSIDFMNLDPDESYGKAQLTIHNLDLKRVSATERNARQAAQDVGTKAKQKAGQTLENAAKESLGKLFGGKRR